MNDPTSNQTPARDRTKNAGTLDNLIRRQLRVSNPNDPEEVARALRTRYRDESEVLRLEAEGVPFFRVARVEARAEAHTAARSELKQALDDVERDLNALGNNPLLKDIQPELRGWSAAIHSAVSEGTMTARYGLDPRQRDRAMAARRLLGDYARIVRYVGALTPNVNVHYRRLAQSLDEVAAVILVALGDSIANIGFGGGRFLLQAPAAELQERRDSVLNALRNLVGTAQQAYGPNDWPRGPVAYRELLAHLDRGGAADLRPLFQENNLSELMDELIDRAAANNAEGLRALGATAQLTLQRFRRLILLGQQLVGLDSPPLTAFLSALQLFLNAFDNAASGSRLVHIARPAIVSYGLYGLSGQSIAAQRLHRLVVYRGQLAEWLDCYLGCGPDQVRCQILLDKILYDVDRAIDLYVMGSDPQGEGEPEQRAAAYGLLMDIFIGGRSSSLTGAAESTPWWEACLLIETQPNELREPRATLASLSTILLWDDKILQECWPSSSSVRDPEWCMALKGIMREELCVQLDAEQQWESLLETMAPHCIRFGGEVLVVPELLEAAIRSLDLDEPLCPAFRVDIPPHYETSLNSIVNDPPTSSTDT